jgi:hypothetical protein
VALEVAARACEMSGRDPKTMPSVFASTHGDLAISDYMSSTLAKTPLLTSPTKFHNSVHNAAAGYWTIGTGCLKPYTSVSGYYFTFAEGLLEAVSQALTEGEPVLYVAFDIEAKGPVATMQPSVGVLAGALVISPAASDRAVAQFTFDVKQDPMARPTQARAENAALVEGNAISNALPFFEALADGAPREVVQALAPQLSLRLQLAPAATAHQAGQALRQRAE